ncbi:MAG: hypothetical protein IKC47_03725 [Clostridia bacterium]|nr:hypothetical protein [Clostridia bacterium]
MNCKKCMIDGVKTFLMARSNCVESCVAYILRRQGYDVVAKLYNDNLYKYAINPFLVFDNPEILVANSFDELKNFVTKDNGEFMIKYKLNNSKYWFTQIIYKDSSNNVGVYDAMRGTESNLEDFSKTVDWSNKIEMVNIHEVTLNNKVGDLVLCSQ